MPCWQRSTKQIWQQIVWSPACSGWQQRTHQNYALQALCGAFHLESPTNAGIVSISWRHYVDTYLYLHIFSGGKVILTCREINIAGDPFLRDNLDPTIQRLCDEGILAWFKKERMPNFLHDHTGMLLVMEPM